MEISVSQLFKMLHHKLFTREEVKTSITILSTGRRVTLSLFVCFLKTNSDASAMLITHGWGDQSPPLDKEEIYLSPSSSVLIDSIIPPDTVDTVLAS